MSPASETAHHRSKHKRRQGKQKLTESEHANLEDLLRELALALLSRGVTPNRFSLLARDAFIRAAAGNSRLKNGKVNRSKVAALTGLPRKEIKRVLDCATTGWEQDQATRMPAERVLQGWLTDQRFLTPKGHPKALVITGGESSFRGLVKEYGGDLSPGAILEELLRSRKVSRFGERLKLQNPKLAITRTGLGVLTRIIPTLVDGLRIASHQPTSAIDSLLYRLRLRASSEADLALIRDRCSSTIQSMLNGLKDSLERQLTIPQRKRPSRHTLTVTVLLAEADTNSLVDRSEVFLKASPADEAPRRLIR